MEEEIEEQKFTDVATITLDFDALDAWRKPNSDDLPVYSFLSIYEACGLNEILTKYSKENDSKQIVAVENILCNFYTLQRLKNYVEHIWEIYSLDIDANNHVFWDPKSQYGKSAHYPKKLKERIHASLVIDFANYCPGVDDDLPDNVLVFRTYKEQDQDANNSEI